MMKTEEKQAAKPIYHQPQVLDYHQPQVLDYGKVKDLTRTTTFKLTRNDGNLNKT